MQGPREPLKEEEIEETKCYLKSAYIPLGLLGFSVSTFLFGFINAGVFGFYNSPSSELHAKIFIAVVGFIIGGCLQFFSGIKTVLNGHLKTGAILTLFGAFWIVIGLYDFIEVLSPNLGPVIINSKNPFNYLTIVQGAYLYFYLLLVLVSFFVAIYRDKVTAVTFFVLVLAFFFLGTAKIIEGSALSANDLIAKAKIAKIFTIVGSVFVIISAICAFYLAWSIVLLIHFGKQLIPLGQPFIEFVRKKKSKPLLTRQKN